MKYAYQIEERCPRCGATLATDQVDVWCTFRGASQQHCATCACKPEGRCLYQRKAQPGDARALFHEHIIDFDPSPVPGCEACARDGNSPVLTPPADYDPYPRPPKG